MTPTPAQFRLACALLRWSPLMLVWNAKVSHDNAGKICGGYNMATVPEEHLHAIYGALVAAGIEFTETNGADAGVRLQTPPLANPDET